MWTSGNNLFEAFPILACSGGLEKERGEIRNKPSKSIVI